MLFPLLCFSQPSKTTSSIKNGLWNILSSWNNGIPNTQKDIININNNIDATSFSSIVIGSSATLNINSGGNLTVNSIEFKNGCNVNVKYGGTLIVLGGLTNDNNSNNIIVSGSLSVSGTLYNGHGAAISGSGVIYAGKYFGDCCIAGHSPNSLRPGDIIIDSVVGGVLPIELLYFKVSCIGKCAKIEWATATETNNNFFIIFKSNDLITWEKLFTINGHGTSSTRNNYECSDCNIEEGMFYYKLRQIDNDGKYKEYDIIYFLYNDFSKKKVIIYPNPVPQGSSFIIEGVPEGDKVLIVDVFGRTYENKDLQPGVYFIFIGEETFKVVVN